MTLDTSATVALYIVLFFVLLFALITVGLLGAMAFALLKIREQVTRALDKADPVVGQVTETLTTVQRITMNAGEKTDVILNRSEEVSQDLADKVETTASVVQKAITKPLIDLSSLIAGITKGVETFSGSNHANNGRK